MESRGGGWRASLTSFSPSVDSVTHPRTGTQTGCASTSLAVISNKRMIMALVKTPPTLFCLLSHGEGSHSAQITWPGDQISLSPCWEGTAPLHILTSNHSSIWSSSFSHEAKWSMKMNEWEPSDSDVHACTFIYIYMSEQERECGGWVLMCIWAGRTIVRLHFY